jgi:C1A family cysteine protease
MEHSTEKPGMGWLPDYPDFRDYTATEKRSIKPMLAKVGVAGQTKAKLPASMDLKAWCSPVEDQGAIGSCTANAASGMVEYFERRAFGKHLDASRLFLYKATRNLLHWKGDTGAFLRSTMGALVLFGVPPEEYWPYETDKFDQEPPAFCYAFAQSYQAISYYRLDPPGTTPGSLVNAIKTNLAAGLPAIFGFTIYGSHTQAAKTGMIPFPAPGEKVVGGHAVLAVGYDDGLKIKNAGPKGVETKGALLIRNSWGAGWGAGGYGWLPYDYVLKGLAVDWWSLVKSEWIDTGAFEL